MSRFFEWLLGLDAGFLGRDGALSLTFEPRFPGAETVGNVTWNLVLVLLAAGLVWFIYTRESGPKRARLILGSVRFVLILLVIVLLNRPQLTLTNNRVEPSVLAVMIDESASMKLDDAGGETRLSRLDRAVQLLCADDAKLLRELSQEHQLRFFRFAGSPQAIGSVGDDIESSVAAIESIRPAGPASRVDASVRSVIASLRGQRLAGVLLFTDGRDTDDASGAEPVAARIFAVPIGTDAGFKNVAIKSVSNEDAVFAGDVVSVKVELDSVGLPEGSTLPVRLTDSAGNTILDHSRPVELDAVVGPDGVARADLQFVAPDPGTLDVVVRVDPQSGEVDDQDNVRPIQIAVLDASIKVLYVDGYPRWEYRFLKQELIRDRTIEVSCLLTSADAGFAQEGDRPITRFPVSLDELLDYDVVLLGDVDPRQFTDAQLQLIAEFVSNRAGGFGMVSGPRFAPRAYAGTEIEPLLPVDVSRVREDDGSTLVAAGFRPKLTPDGRSSSIFRFLRDETQNIDYIENKLPPLFWYAGGVTPKPGVGLVLASGPVDPFTNQPAALVVVGRFGAGRTLFSGIDDAWRWRFHTGESVFNAYWVQSLRYLARGRKIGQRRVTLAVERPAYETGEIVRMRVRLLDPTLSRQLSPELDVQLIDGTGSVVESVRLQKQSDDEFVGATAASRLGQFRLKLPSPAAGIDAIDVPVEFVAPRLELADPRLDRARLVRLAESSGGAVIEPADVAQLPAIIPSARRVVPLLSTQPLWDAPLVFGLFLTLITAEWVGRKVKGMV